MMLFRRILIIVIYACSIFIGYLLYLSHKEKHILSSQRPVSATALLDEKGALEQYMKTHTELGPSSNDKTPVLGGSWHITAVTVDTSLKRIMATYEDGHIQAVGYFTYTYAPETGTITVHSL